MTDPVSPSSSPGFDLLIGASAALRDAVTLGERVAASPLPSVFIHGEAGVGKQLLARCIHRAGRTGTEPFASVSCSALPLPLLRAELFGSENAGDRTPGLFEQVGGGTVFLTDIADLPPELQGALLRVLETRVVLGRDGITEHAVRCRVSVVVKAPLDEPIARGQFLPELHERLDVASIHLPPLRRRLEDIAPLANHILAAHRPDGAAPLVLSDAVHETLRKQLWPGNVRELRNVLERAAVLRGAGEITRAHLLMQQRRNLPIRQGAARASHQIDIPPGGKTLEQIEHEAVEHTLALVGNNHSAAARLLGISRPTLLRKIKAFGLAVT